MAPVRQRPEVAAVQIERMNLVYQRDSHSTDDGYRSFLHISDGMTILFRPAMPTNREIMSYG